MKITVILIFCTIILGAESMKLAKLLKKGKIDMLQRKMAEMLAKASNPEKQHKVMDKLFTFLDSSPYIQSTGEVAHVLLNVIKIFQKITGLDGDALWEQLNKLFPNGHLFPACSSSPYFSDNSLPMPRTSTCCPLPVVTCDNKKTYRTIDGSCNCLTKPNMGRSNRAYARILAPDYADDIGKPRVAKSGNSLPSARKVSSVMFNRKDGNEIDYLTLMHMTIGQMVDHDTDRTPIHKILFKNGTLTDVDCGEDGCSTEGPENEECFPIDIPNDDPFFKKKCIMFVRSQAFMRDDCKIGPREQPNVVTSWLDCSFVYGSTKAELDLVRDYSDPERGRLVTTVNSLNPHCGALLPHKIDTSCRETNDVIQCFQTGDARQNEQNGVTASHVIFVRLHNHFEEKLHELNPHWNGEKKFQEARKILIAVWQNIIYQEYLPPLLGPKFMKKFDLKIQERTSCIITGANVSITGGGSIFLDIKASVSDEVEYDCKNHNADVTNSFATASFRFGHAQITENMKMSNPTHSASRDVHYSEALFRPGNLYETHFENTTCGVDAIFHGHSVQPGQIADRHYPDSMTLHMFTDDTPSGPGMDLGAIDIERGRDHGLKGYTKWRAACDLSVPTSFDDMEDIPASDRTLLSELYEHVDDVDLLVGGLAEKHINGAIVGPTFACMLAHQFRNLKVADRFWFERCGTDTSLTKEQIATIKGYTMGRFLCDTLTKVTKMNANPMMLPRKDALEQLNWSKQKLMNKNHLYKGNDNSRKKCNKLPAINFDLWKEN